MPTLRPYGRFPAECLPLAALLALLPACTGGSKKKQPDSLSASAGTTFSVPSDRLSLEIDGRHLAAVRASSPVDGVEVEAFEYEGAFYVLDLPLDEGVNNIRVVGTFQGGKQRDLDLAVTSQFEDARPVRLDVSPAVAESLPHLARLSISTMLDAADIERLFVDLDGDGIFDLDRSYAESVEVEFTSAGPLRPSVSVLMRDGRLLTADGKSTPLVSVLAPSLADPDLEIADVGTRPVELAHYAAGQELFVLDMDTPAVRRFDFAGHLLGLISLPDLSAPGGMHVDEVGDLYVADTGGNRVLKLLRSTGYGPDPLMPSNGFFGETGVGVGQFDGPSDVTSVGTGLEQFLFVADEGNGRIQLFNRAGVFQLEFDGSDSPGGPLQAPSRLIPAGTGVRVLDGERVILFSQEGAFVSEFAGEADTPADFAGARGIGQASDASLLLSDTERGRVLILDGSGALRRTVGIPQGSPCAALLIPSMVQPRLYVLTEGGDRIDVHPLTTEVAGSDPVAVVTRFLDAVSALDWAAARAEVDETGQELVGLIEASEEAQDLARARMQGFVAPVLRRRTEWSAVVIVEDTVSNEGVEFVLHRSPTTGAWALGIF